MTTEKPSVEGQEQRGQPRAAAALEVDVEVAGERRRVTLVSRDIGPGGIFLRTESPAPIFKRVRLFLEQPGGGRLELGGEVVRSVPPEQAQQKKQPPGMAVAFDEASRRKVADLKSLVAELATRPPQEPPRRPPTEEAARRPSEDKPEEAARRPSEDKPEEAARRPSEDKADALLSELHALLQDDEPRKPAPATRPGAKDDLDEPPEVTDVGRVRPLPANPGPAALEELRRALEEYRRSVRGSTHYDVLLVARTASPAEVKQAFARLVVKLKPRVSSREIPPELSRQLAVCLDKLKKAADTLSHPERRKAYDYVLGGDNGG
jgi:hypothetical protein